MRNFFGKHSHFESQDVARQRSVFLKTIRTEVVEQRSTIYVNFKGSISGRDANDPGDYPHEDLLIPSRVHTSV